MAFGGHRDGLEEEGSVSLLDLLRFTVKLDHVVRELIELRR
jgi:hypothetical protein